MKENYERRIEIKNGKKEGQKGREKDNKST
jgi:hypothetical protein